MRERRRETELMVGESGWCWQISGAFFYLAGDGRENLEGLADTRQASLIPRPKTSIIMPRFRHHVFILHSLMAATQFVKHGRKASPSSPVLRLGPLHPLQIIAIGRNYLDHIKELNNSIPKEPFFFLKPTSSYLPSQTPGAKMEIPRGVLAHHEGYFTPVFRSPFFSRLTKQPQSNLAL